MDLFNLLLPLCRTTSKKRPDLYLSHFLATLRTLASYFAKESCKKIYGRGEGCVNFAKANFRAEFDKNTNKVLTKIEVCRKVEIK